MEDTETDIGWYVSDVHCTRAIGHLSAALAEGGFLPPDFQSPLLLEMWGEALAATMVTSEPSPIGPDPELAEQILRDGKEFGWESLSSKLKQE
jgi:hypothetical protein